MTRILGLGNLLMGDDGFGPLVVHAFDAEYDFGPDVEVFDLGTPGLDLMPWLYDAEHVVIVDTVNTDQPPGTLRRYDRADVLRHPPAARVSPHDPGLKDALLALEFAGRGPRRVTLLGVTPHAVEVSLDLSPAVRDAIPETIAAIVDILARGGQPVTRRTDRPSAAVSWMPIAL